MPGFTVGMPLPTTSFVAYSSNTWPVGAVKRTRRPVARCSPAGTLSVAMPKASMPAARRSSVASSTTLKPR